MLSGEFRPPVAPAVTLNYSYVGLPKAAGNKPLEDFMAWTTPTLVEICIGLEINGYLPAEF